jgi:hypothetical protein
MRIVTALSIVSVALLSAASAWGEESRTRANSRGVFAYYNAEQALAMARATGKPIFVISVRGNDCAGGL